MKPYYQDEAVTIYHGDCRDVLPGIAPVGLVVTSPPYAQQRTYTFDAGQFDWDVVVPVALASVPLIPDGQLLVNLGLVHRDGEVVTYWDSLVRRMREAGHRLFGWYTWDQGFALAGDWNGRFAPSHEWIFHFNRQAKRPNKTKPCDSGSKRISGTFRKADGSLRALTGVGDRVNDMKIPDSVIRTKRARGSDLNEHPAVYPVAFAAELVSAFDGTVLDLFMGSGTTLRAAKDLGRRAIGIEIEERYCEIAAKRMAQEVLFSDASEARKSCM
jgi:DNA modification methylase